MPSLTTQKDFRSVQRLPFCYLCGKTFVTPDKKNRDHVPPECIFRPEDRQPLVLRTHSDCNIGQTLIDEKIGQLIALRYGKTPELEYQRLAISVLPDPDVAALTNLNVDAAVWRWILGFHAALYRAPLLTSGANIRGSLVLPFPKAPTGTSQDSIVPLPRQHLYFVQVIKLNRLKRNLDRISCNKGKLLYECVWDQDDKSGQWKCIFAIDIYDWKDLGGTGQEPKRGCAGFYELPDFSAPEGAARSVKSPIILPNIDPLDPFAS